MYRPFLALRYLVARPISWISMIGIWITVTSMIVTLSIMSGFLVALEGSIRGATADLVVTPLGQRGTGAASSAPVFEATAAALGDVPEVAAICPHLLRPVLLRVGVAPGQPPELEEIDEDNFGELVGLDPARERDVTAFDRWVAATGDLAPADPARPFHLDAAQRRPGEETLPIVLVGLAMYEKLALARGMRVRLATLPDGRAEAGGEGFEPLVLDAIVGGAVKSGHYPNDLRSVYLELDVARAFAASSADATEICVRLAAGSDLDAGASAVAAALEQAGIRAEVSTWRQHYANDLGAVENQRNVLALLLFFFVLVACFNVFATITMLVTDKTRDVGVIAAMGAPPGGILAIFVGCGLAMALLSSLAGALTGTLFALRINDVHEAIWTLTGVRIFKPDVYVFDRIPIDIDPWLLPVVVGATALVALVCALLPALRASRLDPVRALRFE
jgi:ABC-type lipoprotein release transport system permease subunit